MNASIDDALRRLERTVADPAAPRAALDDYVRAVREFRALAVEARQRLEGAAAGIARAREFTRRRRRQADRT